MVQQEYRILIIEDDVDIRQALALFLSGEGYCVCEACDGRQGLTLLESELLNLPKLILLDLFMPVMNGEEFLNHLKGHVVPELASIPVVVVSAASLQDETVQMIKGRVQGFLRKPVNLDMFLECIERYCPKTFEGNTAVAYSS